MESNNILTTIFFASYLVSGCAFNFELTSQKTALENQVMGSYKELDDDVVLLASVRGVNKDGSVLKTAKPSDDAKRAISAKQNQDFNRDDIDELKQKQILGEATTGELLVLPKGVGLAETATAADTELAKTIAREENADREVIVRRIIATNESLGTKDLAAAKVIYRKKIIELSPAGTWVQTDDGSWERKSDKGSPK